MVHCGTRRAFTVISTGASVAVYGCLAMGRSLTEKAVAAFFGSTTRP
jgi:hypothetical protein